MNVTNMKNIIILKNLPSNIVEEAFVVLKENARIKRIQQAEKANVSAIPAKKDYILKEAEMIVHNYISDIEKQKIKEKNINIASKYKRLKKLTIFFGLLLLFDLVIKLI